MSAVTLSLSSPPSPEAARRYVQAYKVHFYMAGTPPQYYINYDYAHRLLGVAFVQLDEAVEWLNEEHEAPDDASMQHILNTLESPLEADGRFYVEHLVMPTWRAYKVACDLLGVVPEYRFGTFRP